MLRGNTAAVIGKRYCQIFSVGILSFYINNRTSRICKSIVNKIAKYGR